MIAWVLIVSMGSTTGYAVSGIATEGECQELHRKIAATYTYGAVPSMHCLPYRLARH